jgi:hypothetical protein
MGGWRHRRQSWKPARPDERSHAHKPIIPANPTSMLGGALLGQKMYADAEPLLRAGYEGMKKQEAKIPPQGQVRIPEALERLVQFCEATDKKDEAAKWREELEARKPPSPPK